MTLLLVIAVRELNLLLVKTVISDIENTKSEIEKSKAKSKKKNNHKRIKHYHKY